MRQESKALRNRAICLAVISKVSHAFRHDFFTVLTALDGDRTKLNDAALSTTLDINRILAKDDATGHRIHDRDGAAAKISGPRRVPRPSCLLKTGGKCLHRECPSWRGDVECVDGECICSRGCAGADGVCYQQENQLVARDLIFRNVMVPQRIIYLTPESETLTEDSVSMGEESAYGRPHKFDVYQLPGQTQPKFLLASGEYAVSISAESVCRLILPGEPNANKHGHSCSPVHFVKARKIGIDDARGQPSAPRLAMRLISAPGHPEAMLIESFLYPRHFVSGDESDIFGNGAAKNSTTKSVTLQTNNGDPGSLGYWKPEPSLPVSLPEYTGPKKNAPWKWDKLPWKSRSCLAYPAAVLMAIVTMPFVL